MIRDHLVEVTWHDAHGTSGWHQPNEVGELIASYHPYVVRTVGFLLDRDKHRVLLGSARQDGTDRFDTIHEIPTEMVKRVRRLR